MRTLILAAGKGTRLGALTQNRPKALVPLFGQPLISYQLKAYALAGLPPPAVVAGYEAEQLAPFAKPLLLNPNFATTNMVASLFCARSLFDDTLLISYGDILFSPNIAAKMAKAPGPVAVAVDRRWEALWRFRMADPLKDAETLKLAPDGTLREIGKKPQSLADIQGQYIGMVRIDRSFFPALTQLYESLDPNRLYDGQPLANLYFTSLIQAVIDAGYPVHGVPIDGGWLEVDTPGDIAAYESPAFLASGLVDFAPFGPLPAAP